MSFTTLLDVAIGLTLVYLAASLCVTVLNEYLAQGLDLRARQLKGDLVRLIDAPDVAASLRQHPALAGFFTAGQQGSSYVEPRVLAQHVLGAIRAGRDAAVGLDDAIDTLPEGALKTNLESLALTAKGESAAFVEQAGAWFDKSLTMMGESYKRRAQEISLVLGLLVAAAFNLDSLAIAHRLYADRDAREALVLASTDLVQKLPADRLSKCLAMKPAELSANADCQPLKGLVDGVRMRNDTFGKLPIGWPAQQLPGALPIGLTLPIGWLITALAISLGASFWFDLLSRMVNIRQGMKKPVVPDPVGG